MDFIKLKEIIINHGDDTVNWLREEIDIVDSVSPNKLLVWCGKYSLLPKLRTIKSDNTNPLQGIADAALILLGTGAFSLYLNDQDILNMINLLVDANIITKEQKAELFSLGTFRQLRWQSLGFEREPENVDLEKSINL